METFQKWNESRDGPFSEEFMRRKLEALHCSGICRKVYPPATSYLHHGHGKGKLVGMLSGSFKIKLDERTFLLERGDVLLIAKGVDHWVDVLGEEPVVTLEGATPKK